MYFINLLLRKIKTFIQNPRELHKKKGFSILKDKLDFTMNHKFISFVFYSLFLL